MPLWPAILEFDIFLGVASVRVQVDLRFRAFFMFYFFFRARFLSTFPFGSFFLHILFQNDFFVLLMFFDLSLRSL